MEEDLSYLDQSRVDEETLATIRFDNVIGAPVFRCAPAVVSCNRTYANAYVAALAEAPKRKRRKKDAPPPSRAALEAEELAYNLRAARLYAETCVRGWVIAPVMRVDERPDGQGGTKKVLVRYPEFSVAATLAFLEGLAKRAPNVFNGLHIWITQESSFTQVTPEELEEDAGNSGRE